MLINRLLMARGSAILKLDTIDIQPYQFEPEEPLQEGNDSDK